MTAFSEYIKSEFPQMDEDLKQYVEGNRCIYDNCKS